MALSRLPWPQARAFRSHSHSRPRRCSHSRLSAPSASLQTWNLATPALSICTRAPRDRPRDFRRPPRTSRTVRTSPLPSSVSAPLQPDSRTFACVPNPSSLSTYIQTKKNGMGMARFARERAVFVVIVCMWALHHIGSCPTIGSERGRIGPGNNHLSGGWRPPRLLWPEKSASSLPDACLSARMALSLRN